VVNTGVTRVNSPVIAMSGQSEGTLVLELADVVAELTRRQRELLGCLREIRVDVLEASATLESSQPPPPRFLQPPPPTTQRGHAERGQDPAVPPVVAPVHAAGPVAPVVAALPPVITPPPPGPSAAVGAKPSPDRHTTRRDYDYFVELDDLLARLPPETEAQDPSPPAGR